MDIWERTVADIVLQNLEVRLGPSYHLELGVNELWVSEKFYVHPGIEFSRRLPAYVNMCNNLKFPFL